MEVDPSTVFVQEFHGQTTIHPLGLGLALLMGVLVLTVPRRYATWPVFALACFVASAQRIVIVGADFTLLRVMVLFGMVRLLTRGELRGLRFNAFDVTVFLWATAAAVIPVLRIGPSAFMYRAGQLYDAIGLYLLFRAVTRDWAGMRTAVRGLMWASLPVAAFILLEWQTRRNVFSIFGGVPEITVIREGRVRCQGAFDHPILLGCFFAAVLPLTAGYWWQDRRSRALVLTSSAACLLIVIASASATPMLSVAAAGLGAMLFMVRHRMRSLRWGIFLCVVGLHLLMNAPVWHLIARINVIGGSSSWHRFALIDGAIRHLDEWWLFGSDVGTAHWGFFTFDTTNFYIAQGQDGGLLLLGLFVAVIAFGFREVGRGLRRFAGDRGNVIFIWAIGVALWTHAVNHFGVSYFGQVWMGWYLLLGMIGGMASYTLPAPRASSGARAVSGYHLQAGGMTA